MDQFLFSRRVFACYLFRKCNLHWSAVVDAFFNSRSSCSIVNAVYRDKNIISEARKIIKNARYINGIDSGIQLRRNSCSVNQSVVWDGLTGDGYGK